MSLRENVVGLLHREANRRDSIPLRIPASWKVALPSEPRLCPPATDEMIDAFIDRTGIEVPLDLRDWWKTCNGARVADGLFGIDNGSSNHNVCLLYDSFSVWRDLKWIPIASDGCGNYYVQVASEEFKTHNPVLFVEPILGPENPQSVVASGVWQFLFFILSASEFCSAQSASRRGNTDLVNRESFWWPSDRDKVLSADPDLAAFTQFPFPWN